MELGATLTESMARLPEIAPIIAFAIGCTGGYHRSIVVAEELRKWLEERSFGTVAVFHRELERE